MVLKEDLELMQNQIETKTQVLISSAVDPLKNKIHDVVKLFRKIEIEGPGFIPNGMNAQVVAGLQKQIDALHSKIYELSIQKRPVSVIGGFRNCGSMNEVKTWTIAKCKEFGMSAPLDMWCPKSGWKGMLFAKFGDIPSRDQFVVKMLSMKPQYDSILVWARAEASVEVRACEKFLSGLIKILVGWGFDFSCIRWDSDGTQNT